MRYAAALDVLGLDGWALMTTHDPVEVLARIAMAKNASEFRERERKQLAADIIGALSKALKKGK